MPSETDGGATRAANSRAIVVSFSGIDGAGKSTQISQLRKRLRGAGLKVDLVTFWDDVARLKGLRETAGHKLFKGDKGVGSPDAPINRRDKNVRSPLMTAVRLFLYLVDAISLRLVVGRAIRSDADVVICDRYAYDELANLTLGRWAAQAYVWFIMKLIPKPDVGIVLDADPVKARARKPEYPVDFLVTCRTSYLALSAMVGGITVVPPKPIEDVEREILGLVVAALASKGVKRTQSDELPGGEDTEISTQVRGRSATTR
jgi:thymidylate kinase